MLTKINSLLASNPVMTNNCSKTIKSVPFFHILQLFPPLQNPGSFDNFQRLLILPLAKLWDSGSSFSIFGRFLWIYKHSTFYILSLAFFMFKALLMLCFLFLLKFKVKKKKNKSKLLHYPFKMANEIQQLTQPQHFSGFQYTFKNSPYYQNSIGWAPV